jgi:hypothetical protein
MASIVHACCASTNTADDNLTKQAYLRVTHTRQAKASSCPKVGQAAGWIKFNVQRCTVLHPTCCMADLLRLREVFVLCQHKHWTHSTALYRLSARSSYEASIANTF